MDTIAGPEAAAGGGEPGNALWVEEGGEGGEEGGQGVGGEGDDVLIEFEVSHE